ncbi:MAG TPA: hypothetical protein V6D22_13970 [Candidatus Obscuribacterales bacterium]
MKSSRYLLTVCFAIACGYVCIPPGSHAQNEDASFFAADSKAALAEAKQSSRPVFVEVTEHG